MTKRYQSRTKAEARAAGRAWAQAAGFLHPVKVDAFGEVWERVYLLHGVPRLEVALGITTGLLRNPGGSQREDQSTFGLRVSVGRCNATARAALNYRATHKPASPAETSELRDLILAPRTLNHDSSQSLHETDKDDLHVLPPALTPDFTPVATKSSSGMGIEYARLVEALANDPVARRTLVAALLADEQ